MTYGGGYNATVFNLDHARCIFRGNSVSGTVTVLYTRNVIGVTYLAAGQYSITLRVPLPTPVGGPYVAGVMTSIAETNPDKNYTCEAELQPDGTCLVHTHRITSGVHEDADVPLDIWFQKFP